MSSITPRYTQAMRYLKVGAVIFGALVITTLGISATDVLTGSSGSLLGQLIAPTEAGPCPSGMLHVPTGATYTCVDAVEASVGPGCPVAAPRSAVESQQNLNEPTCGAVAVAGVSPWTNVTRDQAAAACLRSGKRLPTAAEWYTIALGTPDSSGVCNTDSTGVRSTGVVEDCASAVGIFDAVGNVWEWVDGDIRDGTYNGFALPGEGYVSEVDSTGVPTQTTSVPSELFNADYFWQSASGVYGLLRGGFYGSGSDAGVYALQGKTAPTTATQAIGFRCVR